MSFVIGEMLRLNGEASHPLRGVVDPTRVGAAGHSLGAMTTLALAANTCCHDRRVQAAAVLAGREIPFPNGAFWSRIRTPVLFVHGDADDSVPYADARRSFGAAPPPRFLMTILGGDHGRPYTGAADDRQAQAVAAATTAFFDRFLRGDGAALSRIRAAAGTAGVARLESEL